MNVRQDNVASVGTYDPAPLESPAVYEIAPAKRRIRISDIRRDVPVIGVLASRDFKVKYKQSVLGPIWLFFQPFALLAGFVIAFRGRASVGHDIPYAVFALSGLTVWSFFQASMTIGSASLITNFHLVRFTPCPRLAFPLAAIIASIPSLIVPAVAALFTAAITGTLSPRAVLLPLCFVWLFFLTYGAVALACSLAVRFRDIISVIPFLLALGLFLAPVGYPLASLSHTLRGLIDLNPLTGVLEACRWMMISRYVPSVLAMCISLVITSLISVLAWFVFARLETTMADEI
jgi:lipopolysaccharide transport system permease protein